MNWHHANTSTFTHPTPIPPQSQLYRQLRIPPPPRQNLQRPLNKRPNNRNIPRKLPNRNQKITEEDKQPIQLDQKTGKRPAEENQEDAAEEGGGALEFLAAREEGDCFLEADY